MGHWEGSFDGNHLLVYQISTLNNPIGVDMPLNKTIHLIAIWGESTRDITFEASFVLGQAQDVSVSLNHKSGANA